MDEIASRRPVDRTAAAVTSEGPKWTGSSKKLDMHCQATPHPMRPVAPNQPNLIGTACGNLTVVGLAAWKAANDRWNGSARSRWVCRCACSWYVVRTSKAIKNPKNVDDCCDRCRQLQFLKRREAEIASGVFVPRRQWLESLGQQPADDAVARDSE